MSRLYDPNDPFSPLNPFSAPNMLMKSSAAVYERHRQSVAESARFVERMQAVPRNQVAEIYLRSTPESSPATTYWASTETRAQTEEDPVSWCLLFLGLALGAVTIFLL